MRLLAAGVLALLATGAACGGDATPQPTATPSGALTQGTTYALITSADGTTVTWDELEFRREACKTAGLSEGSSYQEQFEACYGNPDPTLRTAPLDPTTKVIVWPGNDSKRAVGAAALAMEIGAGSGSDIPPPYRVWRIAISGGRVVAVEQVRA